MAKETNLTLDKRLDNIDTRFDDLITVVTSLAKNTEYQFDQINGKFEKVDKQLDKIATIAIKNEHDISELKSDIKYIKDSHERLMNTIDGFIGRIDRYETEQLARDHEVARIKRWVQQIADKTGVKLTA